MQPQLWLLSENACFMFANLYPFINLSAVALLSVSICCAFKCQYVGKSQRDSAFTLVTIFLGPYAVFVHY